MHQFLLPLKSPFCVAYLDDVTVGGPISTLCSDIDSIRGAIDIGLVLNTKKLEIISDSHDRILPLLSQLPDASLCRTTSAVLLGSPIGGDESIMSAIVSKIEALCCIGDRLCLFSLRDSLVLLRYSLSIPRLIFLLRTAPTFRSPGLSDYDSLLCSLLSSILNVSINFQSFSWSQASLPVSLGGLGFRAATQLATSCYYLPLLQLEIS